MIWGGVELALPVSRTEMCRCNGGSPVFYVHIVGCLWGVPQCNMVSVGGPTPPRRGMILTPGHPLVPPSRTRTKRKKQDRAAESPYKLLLQFFFQRPINIALWKKIRAPRGWRKCPTSADAQSKYWSVRFQCRDLKYALTPDEIQDLQARLYLSLELVF